MLIGVAALLLQFSLFFPGNIQAAEKTNATLAAKAAEDAAVSSKSDTASVSEKQVVLSAENSADAEAPVAFAPGRRVAGDPVGPRDDNVEVRKDGDKKKASGQAARFS